MNVRRWPGSWWAALALAALLSLGSYAVPSLPSAGRWQADAAHAVRAESAAVLHYLVAQPRRDDRIANSLYLALLEGEEQWAAAYLERQYAALTRAAVRLPAGDTEAHDVAALTLQTLDHYQALIAAARVNHDAFQHLLADPIGPQLRARALHALDQSIFSALS